MSFSELGLNQSLLDTLARLGYSQPTPIQARAIPTVLAGHDLLAAAQTGTGKTAAFTLPILEQLLQQPNQQPAPTVLVLTPTRELAAQVEENVRTYAGQHRLRSAVIFGGVSPVPQIKQFKRGLDVLIATPGRLLDHAQQGNVDLSRIKTFVLDEADRMLDMGFIHDIRRVIKLLPEQRQNLMFSATFSPEIRKLARTILRNPQEIDVAPRNSTAELIEQKLIFVPKHQKRELLSWLIGSRNWRQVLVFTRTKHGANRLCKQLSDDGLPAAALHGNKSQAARTKALKGFKDGQIRVLVATDIAARGIDIDQLPHVINYEIPNIPADYVHRIGRTGRAGTEGEALSLISADERDYLRDITKLLGRDIPELKLENFYIEQDKAASKPQPGNRSAKKPGHKPGGRSPRSTGRKAVSNSGRPSRKSRQRNRTRRPA